MSGSLCVAETFESLQVKRYRMDRSDRRRRDRRKAAEATQVTYRMMAGMHGPGRYPDIVFETGDGNGYFVAEVRAVVQGIDFDSPEMGPDWMRQFYRRYLAEGPRAAIQWVRMLEDDFRQRIIRTGVVPTNVDDAPLVEEIPLHLGDRIFSKMPIEIRQRFLPMNDFSVDFEHGKIILLFSSLLEEHGKWGTAYYSRLMPKIEVGGKRLTVAFSDHAIRQLCARRTPRYLNYRANVDAHAYLAKCVYHEVVTLSNGTPAIKLWDICDVDGFRVYHDYVRLVFGESNRVPYGGACHYVLGYCPFVQENGFAKAKSFLYPGFRGTPERAILENGVGKAVEYVRWLDDAEDKDAEPFFETPRAVEVTKWLHTHGSPQVVQMRHTVWQD
jgi:hypothetical protein